MTDLRTIADILTALNIGIIDVIHATRQNMTDLEREQAIREISSDWNPPNETSMDLAKSAARCARYAESAYESATTGGDRVKYMEAMEAGVKLSHAYAQASRAVAAAERTAVKINMTPPLVDEATMRVFTDLAEGVDDVSGGCA